MRWIWLLNILSIRQFSAKQEARGDVSAMPNAYVPRETAPTTYIQPITTTCITRRAKHRFTRLLDLSTSPFSRSNHPREKKNPQRGHTKYKLPAKQPAIIFRPISQSVLALSSFTYHNFFPQLFASEPPSSHKGFKDSQPPSSKWVAVSGLESRLRRRVAGAR